MRLRRYACTAVLLTAIVVVPTLAHHSVAATYDSSKATTISGVITSIRWVNPHSWISITVKDATGKDTSWRVEIGGIAPLTKAGFDKNFLDLTHTFTFEIWPARDGSLFAAGRVLTLPDGRQFDVRDRWGENFDPQTGATK